MTATAQPSSERSGTVLSIVVVNFNSWGDVERQVAELSGSAELTRGSCEVVIVDNASDSSPPPSFHSLPRGFKLVLRGENGGFSAGVNAGWRAAAGRWILVLNPDVETGPDLPGRVLGRIGAYESPGSAAPGIVGFALHNQDGTGQPSVGHDPSLFRLLRGLFLPRPVRKYQTGSRTGGSVPWVTGACMLVARAVLDAVGGMDEDFFLYYEEVALCREARRRGWSVAFDPDVQVVHTHPLQNRRLTPGFRVITRHSQLLYFRKHLPAWQFRTLGAIVRLEAWVLGLTARRRGDGREMRAHREVGRIACDLLRGGSVRGPEVRDRARAVMATRDESDGSGRVTRRSRGRANAGKPAAFRTGR